MEGRPEAVWITAESLGRDDPALTAHADLPVVFVFDEALLRRLRLSFARLTFLTEALADLSRERQVQTYRGDVADILADVGGWPRRTPVPGWRRISTRVTIAATYPWPWLRRPHGGSITSFTAWSKSRASRR